VARWGEGYLAAAAPSWAAGLIDAVRAAVGRYYVFSGRAQSFVDGMLTTPGQIRAAIAQFRDLGADEVMLYCHGRDPSQVDRLAQVL
jgi:hypothetical protein